MNTLFKNFIAFDKYRILKIKKCPKTQSFVRPIDNSAREEGISISIKMELSINWYNREACSCFSILRFSKLLHIDEFLIPEHAFHLVHVYVYTFS